MLLKTIKIMNVYTILMIVGFGFGLIFLPVTVKAQSAECAPIELTVAVRDAHGDIIPNVSFQVFRQVNDINGNPKPEKQVASGVIDKNLGRKTIKFTDNHGTYALKMWSIDKTNSHFYFYNDISASCGEAVEVEEVLSSIKITLRDTDKNLRKNTQLSLYTQRYDANHKPIKEKNDLVATLDTSEEGSVSVYVPDRGSSIDGDGTDYYLMEVMGKDGKTFVEYNIYVSSGRETDINYVFSQLELRLKDSKETSFPAGTKIEVYEQESDEDGDNILGEKQKDINTDDDGLATLEIPAGTYVARILGANKAYQYFWDLDVDEGAKSSHDLNTDEDWLPSAGACETKSNLTIITRDIKGVNIPNLKVEIFEQTEDVDKTPKAGAKILSDLIDDYGKAVVSFNPDPRKKYALKIYESNATVGEFWFFNALQLSCGENKEISKNIPAIRFVLRDGQGQLYKNQKFSLYTQKLDVDGKPVKEKNDLVGSNFITSEKGEKTVYLAPDHPYNKEKKGTYVFESARNEGKDIFREYDISATFDQDLNFEYVFSDIVLTFKNGGNEIIAEKQIDIYEQHRNSSGDYELGKLIKSKKTDKNGFLKIEYPAGYYAALLKDDAGQKNIFWNMQIKNRTHNEKEIVPNLVRIRMNDIKGVAKAKGTVVRVYAMTEDIGGGFYKDKKIKEVAVRESGFAQISLMPGAYLFTSVNNKIEYGQALYVENGKLQTVYINPNDADKIQTAQKYNLSKPVAVLSLADRLGGRILLQVEGRGEAWYVDPKTKFRYYLKDGVSAYSMMRKFGLGISNADISKIQVGLDERFEENDYDGDAISDKMEGALGTDMYISDSDNDGYEDGIEVAAAYNPLGIGRTVLDAKLAGKLKGKILLQTESRGEAWYVNPVNGKRYYMQDGDSAYEIMKYLSLGVKDSDLEQIAKGNMGE